MHSNHPPFCKPSFSPVLSSLPVIALVGRPNVGKSTLFNCLTRTRDALVYDVPGVTRDRHYGKGALGSQEYLLIDTGGIGNDLTGAAQTESKLLDTLMAEQTTLAIQEASHVLFLVDAREGLVTGDHEVAKLLRQLNKKVYLVINKIDGLIVEEVSAEFHQLGFSAVFAIASAHGRGCSRMINEVLEMSPLEEINQQTIFTASDDQDTVEEKGFENKKGLEDQDQNEDEASDEDNEPLSLAIIGRPNVGKSTLVNRLAKENRQIVSAIPGTTRSSVDIPITRENQEYILIDTAGVRRRAKVKEPLEKFSVIKSLQAIERANVVLLLIDAFEGISQQDLSLLEYALDSGRPVIVSLNKWDLLSEEQKKLAKNEVRMRLRIASFVPVITISAEHGTGMRELFRAIQQCDQSSRLLLSPSKATKLLEMAVHKNAPPSVRGRPIKLRFAHLGRETPPTLIIHGNQTDSLPESYRRYLSQFYRQQLKLVGTPLKLVFKTGENPFKGQKNPLTARQIQKRKRLKKYIKNKDK